MFPFRKSNKMLNKTTKRKLYKTLVQFQFQCCFKLVQMRMHSSRSYIISSNKILTGSLPYANNAVILIIAGCPETVINFRGTTYKFNCGDFTFDQAEVFF